MPTNDERREVAARLRNLDEQVLDCREYEHRAICAVVGCWGDGEYSDMELKDRLADLIEPEPINGETSDGYHTFNELYHHRALLFSVVVRNYPELCWKSKKHHAGDMYEGMFIVGINTPDGQASYHYDIEPYWDVFECEELEFAPEWDGSTPDQAIKRIGKLTRHEPEPERTCKPIDPFDKETKHIVERGLSHYYWPYKGCPECQRDFPQGSNFCPNCGAKVTE